MMASKIGPKATLEENGNIDRTFPAQITDRLKDHTLAGPSSDVNVLTHSLVRHPSYASQASQADADFINNQK